MNETNVAKACVPGGNQLFYNIISIIYNLVIFRNLMKAGK